MTRIVVTRTGGFAGITRTTEVTDSDAVERILDALRGGRSTDAPTRPDGFTYEVEVEQEAETVETYSLPESALSPELRALLS